MQHKSENKNKIAYPEVSLLRISRLISRCQRTTNNPKKGGPELKPFRTTSLFNGTAFTLIELLVVILIIGILAAVALPQYRVAVLKSRYMQAMSIVDAMWQAQQVYFMANHEYADELAKLDIRLPKGTSNQTNDMAGYV